MTVSEVLDVSTGGRLAEAGTGAVADGITLLQEQVTGVVQLSGIPPLDATHPSASLREEELQ